MLEKHIEKKVCDYAKSIGCIVYKFTSPARAAVPDRLFIYNGCAWFIEFKRTGEKPTPAQRREIARLQAAGMRVGVIDDVEQGREFIHDMVRLFSADT